ncbi:MAG: S8 family serine peptidase [Nanoarchaeota archaeon]|nr:S8 family serine peptidase [Nanoarchaeota archaeon]
MSKKGENRDRLVYYRLSIIIGILILLSIGIVHANPEKINKEIFQKFENLDSKEKVGVIIKTKNGYEIEGDNHKDYYYKKISKDEFEELKYDSDIEKISLSHKISSFLQESIVLTNASYTHATQAFGINLTGLNTTVCVIDSGVNFSHPDLIGKNVSCVIDCFNKECIENCSLDDDEGHGTHVTGIVAASSGIIGISPGANIIAIKVLNSNGDGSGNDLDLSRAIDYCVSRNVSVMTMSLGTATTYSSDCSSLMSPWTESIDIAYSKNISVIAATGNIPASTTSISSPACIANVTPVSAIQKDDLTIGYKRNSLVMLVAPGYVINSTKNIGGYITKSGTSMAAPHVAGAVAIIRQFLNLTGRTRTPLEIELLLNSSGKRVYDSSSLLYFSRIDIYSAILSLDNIPPNVSLITPANNHVNESRDYTFSCNASDYQLANMTFYLYDNNGLVYNETKNISGTTNTSNFNVSNLDYKSYRWNCKASDLLGNYAYFNSNYTLVVGRILSNLISPENPTYTNYNMTNLSCESIAGDGFKLTNVSLYIWNNSNYLIYNETRNISGVTNTTIFNYTLIREGNYSWNCLSYNNASNSSWADNNYTIVYDITNPNISSITSTVSSSSSTMSINSNEETNLTINYGITTSLGSFSRSSSFLNSNSITLNDLTSLTTYYFNSTSCDRANNCIINTSSFTTSATTTNPSSSGGGGGSPASSRKTYSISYEQFEKGYTESLSENDKIKFIEKDKTEHYIIINKIEKYKVNLTIKSNLINIVMDLGQSIKLNISSLEYYGLYIKVESISGNKTNITIKKINEKIIPGKRVLDEIQNNGRNISINEEEKPEIEEKKEEKYQGYKINFTIVSYICLLILVLAIVILGITRSKHHKKREKTINEYGEIFKKNLNLKIKRR